MSALPFNFPCKQAKSKSFIKMGNPSKTSLFQCYLVKIQIVVIFVFKTYGTWQHTQADVTF